MEKIETLTWIDPDRIGGAVCLRGTQVPLSLLFENLAAGLTIDEIVDSYPTLQKDAVIEVLEEALRLLECTALRSSER